MGTADALAAQSAACVAVGQETGGGETVKVRPPTPTYSLTPVI